MKNRTIGELLDSISITHKFEKDRLIFLNTSDVLEGKILVNSYKKVDELKGQAKKTIKENDILFSEIRPKNKRYAYVDIKDTDDYVVSTKLMVLRNKTTDVLTKYIYYFLTYEGTLDYLQMRAENRIGSFPQITFDILKPISLNVPHVRDQQKIVNIISVLDAKIELNQKVNSELEQLVKTLFNFWFVQYDFPNEEGIPYKTSGGKMVYSETLKREIPDGWDAKRLGDVLKTYLGGTPSTANDDFWNGNIPWMNSGEVANFPLISTEQKITKEAITNSSTRFLKEGSVILSITRHLRVNILAIDACINQSIAGIEENDIFKKSYIYFAVLNDIDRLMKLRTGAQQPHINKDIVDSSPFLIPSQQILKIYYEKVNPHVEKIISNGKQIQELVRLRDWLLPMLMNGQVKIIDTDEIINKQPDVVAESSVDFKLNLTDKDKKIRRKILATYIINQSLKDTSFGKTKFEKLLHLIECHIVRRDYNQRYSVQAAGPYDGGFTKLFWNEVTKAKWFKIEEFGMLRRIMPAENHAKSLVDYGYLSDDLKLMINDFIGEFKNTNYERPEIISTLYAVWNNRIIRNEMITDELLKKDFLEWDAQKARYKDRLDNALEWMREKGIIPNGWGSEIRRAKK